MVNVQEPRQARRSRRFLSEVVGSWGGWQDPPCNRMHSASRPDHRDPQEGGMNCGIIWIWSQTTVFPFGLLSTLDQGSTCRALQNDALAYGAGEPITCENLFYEGTPGRQTELGADFSYTAPLGYVQGLS